jgi:hypothetical protein
MFLPLIYFGDKYDRSEFFNLEVVFIAGLPR